MICMIQCNCVKKLKDSFFSIFNPPEKPPEKPSTIADVWLKDFTLYDTTEWIGYIQELIVSNSYPSEDPDHDNTDGKAWVKDLVEEAQRCWPEGHETWPAKDPRQFDGNMRLARELGIILCAWYASVHRAKTKDPNRPIEGRQKAHVSRERWIAALISAVTDDQHDPDVFRQKFENPFADDATDGSFV